MNQGRIWCVVSPTVGLPLFLGSVALMSFTVHFAVLNNSTWVKDFFNGVPLKKASLEKVVDPVAEATTSAKPEMAIEVAQSATPTPDGSTSFVVKVSPKVRTSDQVMPVQG